MAHRKQKGRSRGTTRESPLELKLKEWKVFTSKDATCAPLSTEDLVKFFELADELVSADVERRQITVSKLASPGGLLRVRQLIETFRSDKKRHASIQSAVLSLFYVIGKTEILRSAILEAPVNTIYDAICGDDGASALSLFEIVEDAGGEFSSGDLEVALAVFVHILKLRKPDSLTDGYLPVAKSLEGRGNSMLGETSCAMVVNIRKWIHECQEKLQTRKTILDVLSVKSLSPKLKAKFGSSKDGPCSPSFGWRHDNDFADIRQISIFPTFAEILSQCGEPYLPGLDPTQLHLQGQDGLIDRHFRLYREDVMADMRDTIRNVIMQQRQPALRLKAPGNTPRYYSYHNMSLERLMCDRWEGLVITVAIDQPKEVRALTTARRAEWWNTAARLQPGVLVCLLDYSGHAIFFSVADQRHRFSDENTKAGCNTSQDLSSNPRKAIVSLALVERSDIHRVADLFSGIDHRRNMILLEFPNMIPQTFQPTLTALQSMIGEDNLPFAELLAPKEVGTQEITVEPPMYSQKKNFRFDLSCLMSNEQSLELSPEGRFDTEKLVKGSTLDEKQAQALAHALTRRLALLQGPPGTGKSFISVSLLRVLLATKAIANLGPILVVTYTNHALDQTLEHCLDQGIYNVIRIGSRSKSVKLESMNLRCVSKRTGRTQFEKKEGDSQVSALVRKAEIVNETVRTIFESGKAVDLEEYLKLSYPEHHKQFWRDSQKGARNPFQPKPNPVVSWLQKGYRDGSNRDSDILELLSRKADDIWKMSRNERESLHKFWVEKSQAAHKGKFFSAMEEYARAKKLDDAARQEVDLRCLSGADVIGITTSGLARKLDLLRRVPMKVLLVEEAGEILEAHTLTALLPDVEHAILIGDHLQLKPSVERFQLTSESHGGEKYSLDMSLFERLVSPPIGIPSLKLPCSTLGTQRRMQPAISCLLRQTLYPHLKDDPSVSSYPDVAGMKNSVYWLDHTHLESGGGETGPASMSKSNDFEVKCVVGLAAHLLSQGVYQPKDIAVITPYLGQMYRLKTALSDVTEVVLEVVLDDRDQGRLQQAGYLEGGYMEPEFAQANGEGAKETSLLDALKVATVDNFQGEEAKVVIVSLVRSNKNNQCGFLKTPNRINVLLSRAKHGMYIIGNSKTSAGVPMWVKVLSILEEQKNIGKSLKLNCPRHPNTVMEVFEPADFRRVSPEGGCSLPCDRPLKCGHACNQLCHSDLRHNSVKCLQPCERKKPGCDHPCQWFCGDACEPKCVELLKGTITLDCGHHITDVRCWQRQDQSSLRCDVVLDKRIKRCGHTVRVPCHQDVQDPDFMDCDAVCGGKLKKCKHFCQAPCFACPIYEDGTRNHAACATCSGY